MKRFVIVTLLVFRGTFCVQELFAQNLTVYNKPVFAFVLPNDNIEDKKPAEEIKIVAARGEYEPATFVVYSKETLQNVTVVCPDDLKSDGGGVFRKEDIDISVVKVWKQYPPVSVIKPGQAEVMVPELLLKDDTAPISDAWIEKMYIPPSFPAKLNTEIQAGTSKQIWLTIKVPESTTQGLYHGSVDLLNNGVLIKRLSLSLEVLPFVLPKPNKIYLIYFRGRVARTGGAEYLPESIYLNQLRDIREHGFNGVTIYEKDLKNAEEALRRIQQIGLSGPVIQMTAFMTKEIIDLAPFVNLSDKFGHRPFFYGQDEPNRPEKMKIHILKSKAIRSARGKVVTAITKDWNSQLNTQEPLDWVNFDLCADLVPRKERDNQIQTYYWQTWAETPLLHRLYGGFFLWNSGYDGIFPYVYQAFASESPYQTDVRPPRNLKVFNTTYPSQDCPISTLQWEALREGIDDVRYLTLLDDLIDKARREGKREIAERCQAQVKDILRPFRYYGREFGRSNSPPPESFMEARNNIVKLIIELRRHRN
ncbi:MAG: hypothetical protein ACE144_10105 [Thermodesulfobacteriota bacterium]